MKRRVVLVSLAAVGALFFSTHVLAEDATPSGDKPSRTELPIAHLKDGVPVFDYNYFEDRAVIKADKPVPDGAATIELSFDKAPFKFTGEIEKVVIDVKS